MAEKIKTFTDYIKMSRLNNVKEIMKNKNLEWETLKGIYEDYINNITSLSNAAKTLNEELREAPFAHIVHYRIKDSIHLLDKVVRKTNDKRLINKENYLTEINDLIGIRVLHHYKEDWDKIDKFIRDKWEIEENPVANIRKGDPEELQDLYRKNGCDINPHDAGYRSVHYIITTSPYKKKLTAEIQVRTVFEEAWSEIDHDIRYPNHSDNHLINSYLKIFNRLAGSADEMSSLLKFLKTSEEENRDLETKLNSKDERIDQLEQEIKKLKEDKEDKEKNTVTYKRTGINYYPTIGEGHLFNPASVKKDHTKYSIASDLDIDPLEKISVRPKNSTSLDQYLDMARDSYRYADLGVTSRTNKPNRNWVFLPDPSKRSISE